ncbi:DNA primase [Bacillus aquiflavi]|uniref:DNA primase n=1 Tax=Bacillus aquiflavi TaxID=2672567 RepID=A0A6B3VWS4_9BACI|nr:DNA primase [Bacillus aquiflavi]MBA4535858.1 DNA primase [Bacillus aquiflavi]NEY80233.1 DNA primase [Bacillus aquiflavi]UAC47283.1 DNA primase [Bacillus aquiflavi]
MTERISEEKLSEIRHSVDIVDVIGEHVQLKKQGRNYFGLCPFHGENTPSFSVSPDKQIFHCFGCGAGGDVFSFLMDIEGITFIEAVQKLASKGNIDLPTISSSLKKESAVSKETKRMIEVHELLRKFYHHLLVNTKDGQHAFEYLHERGFTKESLEKFQIGYALDSWDFMTNFLTRRGYSVSFLEKTGLIIKREKTQSYFDRFRNRIMFPIIDHKGNTIAFSGRSLGTEEPKYLNSPETAIFNKSKILYNFHLARQSIRKTEQVVLFEGFADVISAYSSDVLNGVATMGTSLTEAHVATIRRNSNFVTICYDSDQAGVEAAYRAATMLEEAGCNVKIAMLPEGYDPDDYIKQYGKDKFRNDVIGASLTVMSFKLQYYRRGKNLQNEGDQLLYIEEVLKEISMLDKAVERDHYLRQLATEFSLSLEALKQQQRQIYFARKRNGEKQKTLQKDMFLSSHLNQLKPAYHTAERHLIAHMLRSIDLAYKVQQLLQGNTFNIDEHQAIFTYLLGFYEEGHDPNPSAFITFLQDGKLKRIVANIEMMSISDELSEQELSDYIKQVLNYQKMLKIREKEVEEKEAERQKDFLKAATIAMEIIQLRKSL